MAAIRTAVDGSATVAAEMLALTFIRRTVDALHDGDWTLLLRWTDETAETYAGDETLRCLITRFAEETFQQIESLRPERRDEFRAVRQEIERIMLRPRIVRHAASVEALEEVDVVIDALLTQLDQSDPLTAEHSRAVGAWCTRIARRLALSKKDEQVVARCGLIHDIGKSVTPPEILNAPRRLTEQEFDIMRRHAVDGESIVLELPLVAPLAPAVRHHHERFDGRGYPDKLRGSEIPSQARIVAVADAFNAMIGRRPYRQPLPPVVALGQLESGRGTHFDPIVVDAMIDVVTRPERD